MDRRYYADLTRMPANLGRRIDLETEELRIIRQIGPGGWVHMTADRLETAWADCRVVVRRDQQTELGRLEVEAEADGESEEDKVITDADARANAELDRRTGTKGGVENGGVFVFLVDVYIGGDGSGRGISGSGFHLPLILSRLEISPAVAGVRRRVTAAAHPRSHLMALPAALRRRIHRACLAGAAADARASSGRSFSFDGKPDYNSPALDEVRVRGPALLESGLLLAQLQDPHGFYFPHGSGPANTAAARNPLLAACRTLRAEALAALYRHTEFVLDSVDDAVMFLVAIGEIGRAGVRRLDIRWWSRVDAEEDEGRRAEEDRAKKGREKGGSKGKGGSGGGGGGGNATGWPRSHAVRCVQLLARCRRLRRLRLRFDARPLAAVPPAHDFAADAGLAALYRLRHVRRVDIVAPDLSPLHHVVQAQRLARDMSGARELPPESYK